MKKARAGGGSAVSQAIPQTGAEPWEGSPAPEGTPSDLAPETPPHAAPSRRERDLGAIAHWMDDMPSPALDVLG